MIRNFRDHSANERTYLAWIRTSIAVMAFGFLVEKFNLFLSTIAEQLTLKHITLSQSHTGQYIGIALMILGIVMIPVATVRFLLTEREIDLEERHVLRAVFPDILLAALLVLLALFLLTYLTHIIMR
jgi:putative membrane protein